MHEGSDFELVMNAAFVRRLYDEISRATTRVYLQVMTFDGDEAGLGVAQLLIDAAERGVDVQITVDSFAFRYISDTKVSKRIGHDDPEGHAEEVAATHAMFDRMEAAGIAIVYVQPFGRVLQFGPFRNHKKLYVFDDVAYIGGINISDHNFEWLDFNVAVRPAELVETLVDDFAVTRRGEKQSLSGQLVTNAYVETTFDDLLASATESVVVASPYALDSILAKRLAAAPAKHKMVIAPERSNFWTFRRTDPYVRKSLRSNGVELRTFTDFFHAKFALFDDERVFVGSSNFGHHSFLCNEEVGVVIDDPQFVSEIAKLVSGTTDHPGTTSPVQHVVGAAFCKYLHVGTILYDKIFGAHAPTLTTR